jgi:hypothetical protein
MHACVREREEEGEGGGGVAERERARGRASERERERERRERGREGGTVGGKGEIMCACVSAPARNACVCNVQCACAYLDSLAYIASPLQAQAYRSSSAFAYQTQTHIHTHKHNTHTSFMGVYTMASHTDTYPRTRELSTQGGMHNNPYIHKIIP